MLIPHTDFRFEPDSLPSESTYRHLHGEGTEQLRAEILRSIRRECAKTAETTEVEIPVIGITGILFVLAAALMWLLRQGHTTHAGLQIVAAIIGVCAFLGFVGTLLSAGATQSSYKAMLRKKKRFLLRVMKVAQSSVSYEEFSQRYRDLIARR
jgi:hypothetical protein